MKKIINIKEVIIVFMSVALIAVATSVFAVDPSAVLGDGSTINAAEYQNAQTVPQDTNTNTGTENGILNTNTGSNINTNTNTNTNNNNSAKLPQTGIEDYGVGILLIVFAASAIFAYRKVQDYKNI